MGHEGTKSIAVNRKARHDYFVEDSFEAGIELVGTEVKSLRQGSANLKDSYCIVKNGELWVVGLHISPMKKGISLIKIRCGSAVFLCTGVEIDRLFGYVQRDGYSLIPFRFILRTHASSWSSACARAKNCMTSVTPQPRATQNVKWIAP